MLAGCTSPARCSPSSENVAKLMAAPVGQVKPGDDAAPAPAELSGGKILSRAAASWVREKFSGKETK
jgi:hypothetical protein